MRHTMEVEDAIKYGAECALILSNIRFWLDKNLANRKHFHDDKVWTYNSIPAFAELFPYLTEKQLRTRLNKLEDAGIITTGNYNKSSYDQTKWYTVNEQKYCLTSYDSVESPILPNGQMVETEKEIETFQMGRPIPYSKPDIKPYNKTNKDSVFSFEEFWKEYPIKTNKKLAETRYKKISEKNRQKIKDTIHDFINHKQFPGYKHPHAATYISQERWNDEITTSLNNSFNSKQLLARWAAARKYYDNNTSAITILKPEDAEMFEQLKEKYTEQDFDHAMVGFFTQQTDFPQIRLQPSHFLKNFETYLHCYKTGEKLQGRRMKNQNNKIGML